jgi:predicted ATPase
MKIGIIGAQGVGKTTLIDALVQQDEFAGYVHVPSPTRYLKTMFGMDFNNANTEIQLATLSMQINNMLAYEDAFYDRTVIDNLAYLHWYAGRGESDLSANSLNFIQYMSRYLANKLDYIFIIHREFDLVDDGVRNLDPEQQKWIEEDIMRVMAELDVSIQKIFAINGTVEQRVLSVIRFLQEQGEIA